MRRHCGVMGMLIHLYKSVHWSEWVKLSFEMKGGFSDYLKRLSQCGFVRIVKPPAAAFARGQCLNALLHCKIVEPEEPVGRVQTKPRA